jgi:hypothetical protein
MSLHSSQVLSHGTRGGLPQRATAPIWAGITMPGGSGSYSDNPAYLNNYDFVQWF